MLRTLLIGLLACGMCAVRTDKYDSPEWKQEIARRNLPYRKLSESDFPVNDQAGESQTDNLMYTEGFIHYSYEAKWNSSDGKSTAQVTKFDVRSGFSQGKSWRKSSVTDDPALLDHEQGHLDINELYAVDLQHSTLPTGSGPNGQAALSDLDAKLKLLCEKIIQQSRAEQSRYDVETDHGKAEAKQRDWQSDLLGRLKKNHVTYWDGSTPKY